MLILLVQLSNSVNIFIGINIRFAAYFISRKCLFFQGSTNYWWNAELIMILVLMVLVLMGQVVMALVLELLVLIG